MNRIHHTAIVGPHVRLGNRNVIGPFAVLSGSVSIGDDNWIGSMALIGPPPEVRSFDHPAGDDEDSAWGSGVCIGDRNVIRESVQIHQGWREGTRIHDDTFIMNQAYIAHDCAVRARATLASGVRLAGHVTIGSDANLGLGAVVHQGRRIGDGAMVGMGSVVSRDIGPFAKAYGNPARLAGVNTVGATRAALDSEVVAELEVLYSSVPEGRPDGAIARAELHPLLAGVFAGWADPS